VPVEAEMIIAVFAATVLLAFLVQWYFERKKFYAFAEKIPSARNYGILGHGPHFLGKNDEGVPSALSLCLFF
jgi:hypothetical protein